MELSFSIHRNTGESFFSIVGSTFLVILIAIVFINLLFVNISLQVRRLHDVGESGMCLFLGLIPIVNYFISIYLFYLSVTKSDVGKNGYGGTIS